MGKYNTKIVNIYCPKCGFKHQVLAEVIISIGVKQQFSTDSDNRIWINYPKRENKK